MTFRVRASAEIAKPSLSLAALTDEIPEVATREPRPIFWRQLDDTVETPVFQGGQLVPGNLVNGPAVIETRDTTIVVHPGRRATVDGYGNFELELEA